jgi:hypothetical protein
MAPAAAVSALAASLCTLLILPRLLVNAADPFNVS